MLDLRGIRSLQSFCPPCDFEVPTFTEASVVHIIASKHLTYLLSSKKLDT